MKRRNFLQGMLGTAAGLFGSVAVAKPEPVREETVLADDNFLAYRFDVPDWVGVDPADGPDRIGWALVKQQHETMLEQGLRPLSGKGIAGDEVLVGNEETLIVKPRQQGMSELVKEFYNNQATMRLKK